jgi:hypothetical protein
LMKILLIIKINLDLNMIIITRNVNQNVDN